MIVEAELTVRHNWSDVAIHDRNKLANAPLNHFYAWIVGEFGTYLTPMFCGIHDREKWELSPLAPIQCLAMRWVHEENPLAENREYLLRIGPYHQKCFLVCKTNELGTGSIIPIDFAAFMDFVLIGNYLK